ncbi:MAG: hypothetical protein R3283_04190, partial [Balneolaceae bacterium]|nr:hypothetical protein [Balneolaceae bacterium]
LLKIFPASGIWIFGRGFFYAIPSSRSLGTGPRGLESQTIFKQENLKPITRLYKKSPLSSGREGN